MKEKGGALSDPAYDEWGRDPGAPLFIRIAAGGIAGLLRATYATVKGVCLQPELHARILSASDGGEIGAFWHRQIGIAPYFSTATLPWVCLASRSRDGELLARIMACLGGRSVRGSSGRMDGRENCGLLAIKSA